MGGRDGGDATTRSFPLLTPALPPCVRACMGACVSVCVSVFMPSVLTHRKLLQGYHPSYSRQPWPWGRLGSSQNTAGMPLSRARVTANFTQSMAGGGATGERRGQCPKGSVALELAA